MDKGCSSPKCRVELEEKINLVMISVYKCLNTKISRAGVIATVGLIITSIAVLLSLFINSYANTIDKCETKLSTTFSVAISNREDIKVSIEKINKNIQDINSLRGMISAIDVIQAQNSEILEEVKKLNKEKK